MRLQQISEIKLSRLRHTCEQSSISGDSGDVDIISVFIVSETACIQVFNIRNGVNFGSETFFPEIDESINESSLLVYLLVNIICLDKYQKK